MIINCGFGLRVKQNKKVKYIYKNVTGIKIPNGLTHTEIRKELKNSAPDDSGWLITGYCIIKEIS